MWSCTSTPRGVEVPLDAFFEDPTVAHLARLIEQRENRGQATAHLPLGPVPALPTACPKKASQRSAAVKKHQQKRVYMRS